LNIAIEGPKGGKLDLGLQAYATLAVRSFAKQLGISRLKTNIVVRMHSKIHIGEIGTEGLCESLDNRNFVIDVALFGNWLSILAHEMVHVKQFARDEMDAGLTRWKSNHYAGNIDYWDQPWEKEARKLQHKMVAEFDKLD
jgi:hypothetical protein